MEISDSNLKSYKSWQIPKSWHVWNKYHLKPTNITRLFRMTEIELPWLNSDKNNVNILAVQHSLCWVCEVAAPTGEILASQLSYEGEDRRWRGRGRHHNLRCQVPHNPAWPWPWHHARFLSSSVGIRKLKEMYWWGLWGRKHQESFPLHTKDTFQIETQKPLGQEVSVDICQYLLYHLRMYFLYPGRVSVHTIVYLVYTNTLHNPVPALDTVPAPVTMTKNIIHRPHNSGHCQLQAAGVRGSDSGYPDQITQYPAQTSTAHYWESCEWYLERDYMIEQISRNPMGQ